MDGSTLFETLRNAVHDNAVAQAWCLATYGQKHKVYDGIDIRKPPAEDEYPIVHMFPIGISGGYDLEQAEYEIGVVCGIHDSTAAVDGTRANLYVYTGRKNVETFRQKIEDAVTGAIPSGYRLSELSIDYETIEYFPFFLAAMRLLIVKDYYQGDDPYA
jgi:hypothetical protein